MRRRLEPIGRAVAGWLGTGLAGSVLDARLLAGGKSFELSTVILLVITLTGPGYREEDPRDDHEDAGQDAKAAGQDAKE